MKKLFLIIISLLIFNKVNSQNQVNSVFKTVLILDEVIYLENQEKIQNESTIEILINSFDLEISEIEINNYKPSYFQYIRFYQFDLNNNEIIYKTELPIIFKLGDCSTYIISYDLKNNKYFRLKGFRSNDFILFLNNLILNNVEKTKIKSILNDLKALNINELNFNCLFNASKDSPLNWSKYPCMQSCSGTIIQH